MPSMIHKEVLNETEKIKQEMNQKSLSNIQGLRTELSSIIHTEISTKIPAISSAPPRQESSKNDDTGKTFEIMVESGSGYKNILSIKNTGSADGTHAEGARSYGTVCFVLSISASCNKYHIFSSYRVDSSSKLCTLLHGIQTQNNLLNLSIDNSNTCIVSIKRLDSSVQTSVTYSIIPSSFSVVSLIN